MDGKNFGKALRHNYLDSIWYQTTFECCTDLGNFKDTFKIFQNEA